METQDNALVEQSGGRGCIDTHSTADSHVPTLNHDSCTSQRTAILPRTRSEWSQANGALDENQRVAINARRLLQPITQWNKPFPSAVNELEQAQVITLEEAKLKSDISHILAIL